MVTRAQVARLGQRIDALAGSSAHLHEIVTVSHGPNPLRVTRAELLAIMDAVDGKSRAQPRDVSASQSGV